MSKQRIWELDALRGLCVLGMILIHLLYDLTDLMGVGWTYPAALLWLQDWGGVFFILISGICATLGSRSVRRGLIVFGCGLLCSAATIGAAALGLAGRSIIIMFGILHCLGLSMLLWQPVRRLPAWVLAILAAVIILLGLQFEGIRMSTDLFFPLGLRSSTFRSADYFPLLPFFGFFLLGAVLGKTLYRRQTTLLPHVNTRNAAMRFLSGCGRNSLVIYLLHQPVLMGIFAILDLLS